MSDVLARVCADKRAHVRRRMLARPLAEVTALARAAPPPRRFAASLAAAVARGQYGMICEIKRASPSRGLIRADFDPATLARAYAEGGATCLSVLTDEPYFQGSDEHLVQARSAVDLPVLRKDFLLEPYQMVEARALGADCVLVILAAVSDAQAQELMQLASTWNMDVLVEVHDEEEMNRALRLEAHLIGINNRNLKSLAVDLQTTESLAPMALVAGDRLVVSESGLSTPADLSRMARAGVRCFLVGESLMRQADVTAATRALLASPHA